MHIFRRILSVFNQLNNSGIYDIRYEKLKKTSPKKGYPKKSLQLTVKRYRRSASKITKSYVEKSNVIKELRNFVDNECSPYLKGFGVKKILDVGCGVGDYSKIFKYTKVFKKAIYSGCEIEQTLVNVCKKVNSGNFFLSRADEINAKNSSFELVFCSGVLQYTLQKWKESLKEIKRVGRKYILITRLPVSKFNPTFFVKQKVRTINGPENLYLVVFNRKELESEFKLLKLKVLKRDYSSFEHFTVEGVDERIVHVEYLLEIL